jgi:Ca2+-binding RTX toxin-like protein
MADFTGTPGPDVIVGTPHADMISSGLGDDMITGRGGDDVIFADVTFIPGLGQANNDIVYGDAGNDVIFVGSGQDIVYGGKGDDHITVAAAGMGIPFIPDDGPDTVVFEYNSHSGRGIGHDVINVLQQGDVLVFLSDNTNSLADLASQTRLVDAGENAYRIEWLKGDQSITLHLDNGYLNFGKPPQEQVNWDDFTTLDDLATVLTFQFHGLA